MSTDEDLQSNPLFQSVQETSEIFSNAAQKNYIICVPPNASLKSVKITKEIVESHVLKLSPYYKDAYVTLNGKNVTIKEKKIGCGKGFSDERTATVLFEELYYDDNFESFKILRIDIPLVGKIPDGATKSSVASTTTVERRSLVEHEAILIRMLSEAQSSITDQQQYPLNVLNNSSQRFIQSFNTSYLMVKGFISHAGAKVKDTCVAMREEALSKVPTSIKSKWTKTQLAELQVAIESCVIAQINKKVFTGLCELYATEDEATARRMNKMQSVTMVQCGVRPELVCDTTKAVRRLALLNACTTPFEKLCCLEDVTRLLMEAVDEESKSKSKTSTIDKKEDTVLSADDIVPMTVFILIKSQMKHLHANLQYIQHFPPGVNQHGEKSELNTSHLSVYLANFTGALQYIDSEKLLMGDDSSPTTSLSSLRLDPIPISSIPMPRSSQSDIGHKTTRTPTSPSSDIKRSKSASISSTTPMKSKDLIYSPVSSARSDSSLRRRGSKEKEKVSPPMGHKDSPWSVSTSSISSTVDRELLFSTSKDSPKTTSSRYYSSTPSPVSTSRSSIGSSSTAKSPSRRSVPGTAQLDISDAEIREETRRAAKENPLGDFISALRASGSGVVSGNRSQF